MPSHIQHGVFDVSLHQVPAANLFINLHSPSITLSYWLSATLYITQEIKYRELEKTVRFSFMKNVCSGKEMPSCCNLDSPSNHIINFMDLLEDVSLTHGRLLFPPSFRLASAIQRGRSAQNNTGSVPPSRGTPCTHLRGLFN